MSERERKQGPTGDGCEIELRMRILARSMVPLQNERGFRERATGEELHEEGGQSEDRWMSCGLSRWLASKLRERGDG